MLGVSESAVILFSDHDPAAETQAELQAVYRAQDQTRANLSRRRSYKWKTADRPWVKAGFRTRAAWAAANPRAFAEYRQAQWVNDYHRKRTLGRPSRGGWKPDGWFDICKAFGYCCAYCGVARSVLRKQKKGLTCDHVIAVSKGGPHVADNASPACRPCNTSKWNRDLVAWAAKTGRTVHPLALEKYRKMADALNLGRPGCEASQGHQADNPLAEDRGVPDGSESGGVAGVA